MRWTLATAAAAIVILIASTFLATQGTWEFFSNGLGFVTFYDYQAASLLEGHWDVPPQAISGEAIIHAGKYYGYFGFAPALPRVVLNALWPARFGMWSHISLLMAMIALIAAFLALAKLIEIPRSLRPFLMLITIGGSTAMFVCASGLIYHEAIIWGASLAIWGYLCFGWYLKTVQFRYLALGALFGAGSFFSRLTSGAGVVLCAVLLAASLLIRAWRRAPVSLRSAMDWMNIPRPRSPALHASFLLLYAVLVLAGFIRINYAKFETYLDQAPVRYNSQYIPARREKIHGTLVHPEFLVFNTANYFDPRHIAIKSKFPYLGLNTQIESSSLQLDQVEPYAAFPMAMPALFALSIVGVAALLRPSGQKARRYLLILGPALLMGVGLLIYADISYRYQHDWYSFFFSGPSSEQLWSTYACRASTIAALTGLGIAGVWSILASIGFIEDLRHSGLFGW